MGCRRRFAQGFSLIELMIAVAIIDILSAIAIPGFLKFQLRAKAGEAKVNMGSLAVAEEVYFAERGVYASTANPAPAVIPGTSRVVWSNNTEFDEIGWKPEGAVLFQYMVSADRTGGDRFLIEAAGDLDGDGAPSFFGFIKPANGTGPNGRIAGSTCVGSGMYTPVSGSQTLMNAPGPCDSNSGRAVF